jgi:hypothetical protein
MLMNYKDRFRREGGTLWSYQGSLVHVTSVSEFWNEATVYFVSPVGKQQIGCFKVGLPRLQKLNG